MYKARFELATYRAQATAHGFYELKISSDCNLISFRAGLISNVLIGPSAPARNNPDISELQESFPTVDGFTLIPAYQVRTGTLSADPAEVQKIANTFEQNDLVLDAGHPEAVIKGVFVLRFPRTPATSFYPMRVQVVKRFIEKVNAPGTPSPK